MMLCSDAHVGTSRLCQVDVHTTVFKTDLTPLLTLTMLKPFVLHLAGKGGKIAKKVIISYVEEHDLMTLKQSIVIA